MYIIRIRKFNNETYFYRKKNDKMQVFIFNSPQEVSKCLQLFQEYAVTEMLNNGNPFGLGEVMSFISNCEICEVNDNFLNKFECEKILFIDILKEKGINI